MSVNSPFNLLLAVMLLGYTSLKGQDLEDELTAAEPLDDLRENTKQDDFTEIPSVENPNTASYRGYALMENIQQKDRSGNFSSQFPNWELGLETDIALPKGEIFIDGTGYYIDDQNPHPKGFINQFGLRYRPIDSLQLAVGKERNKRSPAMIISPSDFIHSNDQAPGLREEREGVWLVRMSYQLLHFTTDLILLPSEKQKANGFPEDPADPLGAALRLYIRTGIADIGISAGRLEGSKRWGTFAQGFLAKVWKIYAEAGYEENRQVMLWRRNSIAWLFGAAYEGSSNYRLLAEYLAQPAMLSGEETAILIAMRDGNFSGQGQSSSATPSIANENGIMLTSPFIRRQYLLFNGSYSMLDDHWNLFLTYAKSLDDHFYFSISRIEYLLGSAWTIGATYMSFDRKGNYSANLRPLDERFQMDIKWSF